MIRKTMFALAAIGTLASSTPAALTAVAGTTVVLSAVASSPAAAAQCGQRVSVQGIPAVGAIFSLKKSRAERRAKRGWRGFVAGEKGASIFSQFTNTNHPSFGLGTRYADLSNARDVVINCKGGGKMYCTVTATPCTK